MSNDSKQPEKPWFLLFSTPPNPFISRSVFPTDDLPRTDRIEVQQKILYTFTFIQNTITDLLKDGIYTMYGGPYNYRNSDDEHDYSRSIEKADLAAYPLDGSDNNQLLKLAKLIYAPQNGTRHESEARAPFTLKLPELSIKDGSFRLSRPRQIQFGDLGKYSYRNVNIYGFPDWFRTYRFLLSYDISTAQGQTQTVPPIPLEVFWSVTDSKWYFKGPNVSKAVISTNDKYNKFTSFDLENIGFSNITFDNYKIRESLRDDPKARELLYVQYESSFGLTYPDNKDFIPPAGETRIPTSLYFDSSYGPNNDNLYFYWNPTDPNKYISKIRILEFTAPTAVNQHDDDAPKRT